MRGGPSGVHERLTRRAGAWTRGAAAVTLAVILAATMAVLLARPHASPALTVPTVTAAPAQTVPTVTVPTIPVPKPPPVTVPKPPTVTVPKPPPVTVPKPPPVTVTPPAKVPAQAPAIHTPTVSTPSVPGATSPTRVPSVGSGSRSNLPGAQGVVGSSGQSASSRAPTPSGATSSSSSLSAGSSTAGSAMAIRSTGAARDRHGAPAGNGAGRRHKHPLLSSRRLRRLVSHLKGCLSSLAPRQTNVLVLRTGLGLKHAYSRRQVARILHVTLQREGAVERQAAAGLRGASARGRCMSGQSSVPKAVALTVSLLASTNQLGPTANTSPSAFSSSPQSAGKSSSPNGGGARPTSGDGGSSNPQVKSASISPQQHGGLDWLVLALLAAAALMALWVIVARRQADPQTAAAAAHPGLRRLRRVSWAPGLEQLRQGASSLAGAVGLVALRDAAAHRRRRRAATDSSSLARRQHQAAGASAEPAPARVPVEPSPDRIEQVKALQRQLNWLGFEPGTVDGRYGPITTGAVKRFQEAHDLTVDGVVGHGTRDVLRASFAQRPSSDRIDRVKGLQRQLSWLGYEPGPVDGRYGPLTTAAVARFQDSHELPADGVVDRATQTALHRSMQNYGQP
jgi:outer membrane biosynthesis protein TonB